MNTAIKSRLKLAVLSLAIVGIGSQAGLAQTRKNIFQTGEQLTYNVKYGFIKLGTVVIQTAGIGSDGKVNARMQFWTADVPFLNTKTTVIDLIDSKDITISKFNEKTQNGDNTYTRQIVYDRNAKSMTYSDEKTPAEVQNNIPPFNDALSLLFNMRSWSGAAGHKYSFGMRSHDGVKPVVVNFTNKIETQSVPALDDKEIPTRVLEGQADMGSSSPLGANGAFTAYVSNDDAAIPVRIDMSIAVGSISLVLEKVKRTDWAAAK